MRKTCLIGLLIGIELSVGVAISEQFMVVNDEFVEDKSSGLIWQKNPPSSTKIWSDALAYCESLSIAGKGDWRLPNIKELQSLIDHRKAYGNLKISSFLSGNGTNYVSSTTVAHSENSIWYVGFHNGTTGGHLKEDPAHIRCVRSSID